MAYSDSSSTDPNGGDDKLTAKYIDAIDRYDRGTETWRRQSELINKIYLDQDRTTASPRRFALLWSNIETLKPAVYARLPVAVVSRRFKDADQIGRQAGEILERCINTTFDLYGVNDVLELVRDDRLLTSRGQAWVRYEAQFEPSGSVGDGADSADDSETPAVEQPSQSGDGSGRVSTEYVCIEYVNWADFGHTLNRTWPEVTAVWRRVYMTKAKVTERWDEKVADRLTYAVRPEYAQKYGPDIKDATQPQAIIYEIWDKDEKEVCWLAKEEKIVLESGQPPLNFRNFFPCPKPAYGTRSTGSLIPTPDYRYYQDQAEEINDLTEKIDALQDWLVLKAFIPAGPDSEGGKAIVSLLQAMTDKLSDKGIFVPVESWAGFQERGGARLIDWLPMDMVIQTIDAAIKCRAQLVQDVFQITGISDILRGETDPNETLGAQQIKAQTGSRRIQTCQRDLARFARDLAELVGEVISEYFSPETMSEMSGFDLTQEAPPELMLQARSLMMQVQQSQQPALPAPAGGAAPGGGVGGIATPAPPPPNPQAIQQLQAIQGQLQQIQQNKAVLALLRDEKTRNFRIEIETDSTIEPDETQEKQKRVEFITAAGQFFQQAMPVLQLQPELAGLMGGMLMFLVRGFRVGRELEDQVEQAVEAVQSKAQQPPPPDPEMMKAQQELALSKQNHDAEMAQNQQKFEQEMTHGQQLHEQKMVEAKANLVTKITTAAAQAATKPKPTANGEGGEQQAAPEPMVDPMELMAMLQRVLAPQPNKGMRVIRDGSGRVSHTEPIH